MKIVIHKFIFYDSTFIVRLLTIFLETRRSYTHIVIPLNARLISKPGPFHRSQKRVTKVFAEQTVDVKSHRVVKKFEYVC